MTTLFISHSSKDKAWAERMLRVLSDSGYQSLFLDLHPDDGIPAGTDWERMLYQIFRRSLGVVVLCSANWLASPWCVAEALIARQRGRPVFLLATLDAVPQIPDFLKNSQFISLAGVSEQTAYQRLLQGLEEQGLKEKDFMLPPRPYPGLEPFQEGDAAVFFGRRDEIERVKEVLNRRRLNNANGFIAVLGASGCGKSSLVRAGVLPRLRRAGEEKDAGAEWVIVPSFFGREGLEGLTFKLETAFDKAGKPQKPDTISEKLEAAYEQTRGIERAAEALRKLANNLLLASGLPDGHVLLVLDQLEEVFTTAEGSDARAMLRLLLVASAHPVSSIVVLATMRSNFLDDFQNFEGAADRYEKITLDPMLRSHISEVIEGPADRFGLDLEVGLSERMVAETAYNDALPLLAFTLEKLYEKCTAQGRLTLEAYDELGGVLASIKHFADKVLEDTGYAGLPADDHRMRDLRRAFYRLARVTEEGQFTRRTARWSQMPSSCRKVLECLVNQRLLVSDVQNGQPTLNVAHEALFRVWDTLHGWLVHDRKVLALRAQIEEAAAEWNRQERAASRTWAEERILDAVSEIEKSGVSLADVSDQATVNAFLGPTDPEILEALPALFEGEDARAGSGRYGDVWRLPLGHVARASVGVRLALLGDRRKGVGLRADGLPDIDWRLIESGEVTIEIRADPFNPNSELVRTLRRVVAPFRIARYPVTVIQFQAFLENCQRYGKLKLPRGFPLDLYDYQPPRHWARYGNYSADSVNWYDAAAFCHWLSARLGFLVRLPTEAEWQFAAGGELVRSWPWGPNWDPLQEPWRANTIESELNRSSAVGLYPLGASSAGALDMAGAVWEWCRNAFNDPDNIGFPINPSDRRTRRGGSWADDRDSARCAGRVGSGPDFRSGNIGFRPVSPILDC